jgi:hypothetical protein
MANTALKILGVVATATTLFAFKKKRDYTEVINNMTIDLHDLSKLRSSQGKIFMNAALAFHNNTAYDFDVYTAGLIKLKRMTLKYKNQVIGNAYSNLTSFSLPANSNVVVSNIQLEIVALNLAILWLNGGIDLNLSNYQFDVEIEAFGKPFVIEGLQQ